MTSKLALVIRKEYVERVRTRSFAIGTILGPILLAAMMFGPALLAERTGPEEQTIAVIDQADGSALASLQAMVDAASGGERFPLTLRPEGTAGTTLDEVRSRLDAEVVDGTLDGYVVLAPDFLESGKGTYYGKKLSGVIGLDLLEGLLDQVVQQRRMQELGLASADLAKVLAGADIEKRAVGKADSGSLESRLMIGIAMIMLLYFMMIFYGQFTMTAVIEDKSSRVVEVMLASVTPTQLMLGKVLAQGLVGFTQFSLWVAATFAFANFGGKVAGIQIDVGQVSFDLWAWFGVFFVLGFLLYSSLYAGVGALCSTLQDAQQYQGPITMLIVIPMLLLQVAIQAPDSGVSLVLSLIPLFAPILMFIRIVVGDPALWQILASVLLLLGTVVLSLQLTGKLFRISILRFGKAPGWKDVVRMLRSPE